MSDLPPVAPGFVRLQVHLGRGASLTPGEVAQATGVDAADLGPIALDGRTASVDVIAQRGREARQHLSALGITQLIERNWVWLRLSVGRNHGLAMGQFRKVMANAGTKTLGRIVIQNTHCLVGLPDDVANDILPRLEKTRVNGYLVRPSILPAKAGPGSPEFIRGT